MRSSFMVNVGCVKKCGSHHCEGNDTWAAKNGLNIFPFITIYIGGFYRLFKSPKTNLLRMFHFTNKKDFLQKSEQTFVLYYVTENTFLYKIIRQIEFKIFFIL